MKLRKFYPNMLRIFTMNEYWVSSNTFLHHCDDLTNLLEMILWYSSFILSMQKYMLIFTYQPGISEIKLSILDMLPLLIFSLGFFHFLMSEIYLYFFLSSNILCWALLLYGCSVLVKWVKEDFLFVLFSERICVWLKVCILWTMFHEINIPVSEFDSK